MSNEEKAKKILELCIPEVLEVYEIVTDYFGEDLVDTEREKHERYVLSFYNESFGYLIHEAGQYSTFTLTEEEYNNIKDKHFWEVVTEEMFPYFAERLKNHFENAEYKFEIKIRFPSLTVTNEYGKSIDITELYAQVKLYATGTLADNFTLYRAEYTMDQWINSYAHSHLPGRYLDWQRPCLGSGPINDTEYVLLHNYDYDRWGLFCYELSKYVRTESVKGGPYHRLESVNKSNIVNTDSIIEYRMYLPFISNHRDLIIRFIKYYLIKNSIPIAYRNNNITLGERFSTFWVKISRTFITWYNKEYSLCNYTMDEANLKRVLLKEYVLEGNVIYEKLNDSVYSNITSVIGTKLFKFKGEDVKLNITKIRSNDNSVLLLSQSIVNFILTKTLRLLNLYYGREEKNFESREEFYLV